MPCACGETMVVGDSCYRCGAWLELSDDDLLNSFQSGDEQKKPPTNKKRKTVQPAAPRDLAVHAQDELIDVQHGYLLRNADANCVVPANAASCLEHANNAMFRNVHTLLLIICVFPLTTCTCERCNSALKRLKTRLRDMGTPRLSALTMLNVYPAEQIDLEKVIDLAGLLRAEAHSAERT